MLFLSFSLERRSQFTGEYDADDEPICRKSRSTVRINAANIVSIEERVFVDRTDLIIKTIDGETWTLPGTDAHLAELERSEIRPRQLREDLF